MNKSRVKSYKIPSELEAELDSIIEPQIGGNRARFTPEQDAIIKKYWPVKKRPELVEWFKARYGFGSKQTLLRRYKELTKK